MGNCGSQSDVEKAKTGKTSLEQLQHAVNRLFEKYDTDLSGYLERAEVEKIVNAALTEIEGNRVAKPEEVTQLIERSDVNKDGKISKQELLKLFRKVAKI